MAWEAYSCFSIQVSSWWQWPCHDWPARVGTEKSAFVAILFCMRRPQSMAVLTTSLSLHSQEGKQMRGDTIIPVWELDPSKWFSFSGTKCQEGLLWTTLEQWLEGLEMSSSYSQDSNARFSAGSSTPLPVLSTLPQTVRLEACMGTRISQHSLPRVLYENRRHLHKIWNVGKRWTPLSGSSAERSRCVALADGGSSEVCTVPCEPPALGSVSLAWLVFSGCFDFLLWDLEVSLGVSSYGFPWLLVLQPL